MVRNVASSDRYDLALVFVSFQRCCIYLPIIKQLSENYKIAVCPQEVDEKTGIRTRNTINMVLQLCERYGAEIVYNRKIEAEITILPQAKYNKETIDLINESIISNQKFWLSGLAMGNALYDYLHGTKIDKILVIDRNFYKFRIEKYETKSKPEFDEDDVVEIGVPFKKYPVFPDCGIDYLLANPTPFSFRFASDRIDYLENVQHLVRLTDKRDVIALKPHNADERVDYIVNKKIYEIMQISMLKPFHGIIDKVARIVTKTIEPGFLKDLFVNVSIAILYVKLMKRVVHFRDITEFHNLNLEAFLPSVKKGLITGRSNSIWHGLYNRIPVYNCIDEDKEYFSDTKMHKYSMEYMKVHGNYQTLDFDKSYFELIDDRTRNADIFIFLREQIEKTRTLR